MHTNLYIYPHTYTQKIRKEEEEEEEEEVKEEEEDIESCLLLEGIN